MEIEKNQKIFGCYQVTTTSLFNVSYLMKILCKFRFSNVLQTMSQNRPCLQGGDKKQMCKIIANYPNLNIFSE